MLHSKGDELLKHCIHIMESYFLLDVDQVLTANLPDFATAIENLISEVPLNALNALHYVSDACRLILLIKRTVSTAN